MVLWGCDWRKAFQSEMVWGDLLGGISILSGHRVTLWKTQSSTMFIFFTVVHGDDLRDTLWATFISLFSKTDDNHPSNPQDWHYGFERLY